MKTTPATESVQGFGNQLYEAFRAAGRLDFLTRRFNYHAIQRLKKADREQTLKLFQGSSWGILQRLKSDTPQQVVVYFLEQERRQAIGMAWVMLAFAMVSSWSTSLYASLPAVSDVITILASIGACWAGMCFAMSKHGRMRPFRYYSSANKDCV